ncbi:toll/interleukin-1 receptor domain-containing protein [Sorangium sp. So ce260]|uniref:toll/interleukin-1 receptor domain-containing protein n=1 Tax=Sorangium sp. So ce260 TaxID=3133291 RepID=UPI003F5E01CC
MPPSSDRPLRLLICFSPEDRELKDQLARHLQVLARFARIELWSAEQIRAGAETHREVEQAIDRADVALLLLSSEFLASDTLLNVELPQLQQRHSSGRLRVIPVLLRSCLWDLHPWLKKLHPLPKGGKPIGSFSGEERDAALTEVAREIIGLPATPMGRTTADGNDEPMQASAPTPRASGDTYNIQIHGSIIGALGAGTGSKVTGQASEHRPTLAVAQAPAEGDWPPLVVLGPHVIAEGARIAASGNIWTVRLRRFLLGDTSALGQVSEMNGTLPPDDRFIVLNDPGEARAIAGNLGWQAKEGCLDVHVPVGPSPPKRSVVELEATDIDTLRRVRGVAAGRTFLQTWLGTAIGLTEAGFGSWIPEWQRVPELAARLGDLVRMEILRLSSVPHVNESTDEVVAPLGFVDRVISVQPHVERATDHVIPVDIELTFFRGGAWRGEIGIARQPVDPDARGKMLQELLDRFQRS